MDTIHLNKVKSIKQQVKEINTITKHRTNQPTGMFRTNSKYTKGKV